jgi:RNA polymerase sigma factor (sigma-70 family)
VFHPGLGAQRALISATPMSRHNNNEDDDATLVARCLKGEAAAWTVLVQRYQRLVYAVVRRIGLDEHAAADVFQTVFSRLIEHLPKLNQPDRLQAWIVTTAKRETLLAREKSRRHVSLTRDDDVSSSLEDTLVDDAPLTEDALSDLQQLHLLRTGMAQLDERCRELLTLVFRDEDEHMPYDEVARRLGVPTGSIGPTRSRCLDKLRKLVVQAESGAAQQNA